MKKIIPPTSEKVPKHTNNKINTKIREETICSINVYKSSRESELSGKIDRLNYEWDTEKILETNAASIVLATSIVGFIKSKRCCFLLTGTIGLFLLQHALLGWCPPVPIIRRLGVRTSEEIKKEQMALKYLRGDFTEKETDPEKILKMIEK